MSAGSSGTSGEHALAAKLRSEHYAKNGRSATMSSHPRARLTHLRQDASAFRGEPPAVPSALTRRVFRRAWRTPPTLPLAPVDTAGGSPAGFALSGLEASSGPARGHSDFSPAGELASPQRPFAHVAGVKTKSARGRSKTPSGNVRFPPAAAADALALSTHRVPLAQLATAPVDLCLIAPSKQSEASSARRIKSWRQKPPPHSQSPFGRTKPTTTNFAGRAFRAFGREIADGNQCAESGERITRTIVGRKGRVSRGSRRHSGHVHLSMTIR